VFDGVGGVEWALTAAWIAGTYSQAAGCAGDAEAQEYVWVGVGERM